MSRPQTKNPTKLRLPQLREGSQGKTKIMRMYYRNGQLHEEQPRFKGRIHGVLRRWHKNGVLASEATAIGSMPSSRKLSIDSAPVRFDSPSPEAVVRRL